MSDNLKDYIDRFKFPIALSVLGLVLIVGGLFVSSNGAQAQKEFPKESLVASEKIISIDVSGEVNTPGVYKLKEGLRIEDAINAAGGFTPKANQEYISKSLNLAQKLVDGTKLYIPAEGEEAAIASNAEVAGVNSASAVNINSATQAELEALPGIGPVTASKVISGRPYQNIDELINKKIIGKSVFDKIKSSIAVY